VPSPGPAGIVTSQPSGELSHALLMGLVYSILHVLGPDHLGTLMTLSTVMNRQRAFHVGALWGLGHSFGMALIAGILLSLHKLVHIDVQRWEHYGDYLIGLSMVGCALYFITHESKFLEQRSDGTYISVPCACHGGGSKKLNVRRHRDKGGPVKGKFCEAFMTGKQELEEGNEDETMPLVDGPEQLQGSICPPVRPAVCGTEDHCSTDVERNMRSAVLGVFQGLCCPMGLVGLSFLAQLPSKGIIGFLVVFIFMSAFGTASLAAGWANLTSNGIGVSISPQVVYRSSCVFTLVLGLTWVTANFCGFLGKLDYTEGFAPA